MKIEAYSFDYNGLEKLSKKTKGKDWPVVYLIHDNNEIYVGETTSASYRMKQHLSNPEKEHLEIIDIVFDDTYNKSVILDFEQRLIKCLEVDKTFQTILNKNKGQSSSHEYYDRNNYEKNFKSLWNELLKRGFARKQLEIIENDNLFKYSPYNSLTEEQNEISVEIINDILLKLSNNEKGTSIINGCAGTGKTVLAISMINSLVNAIKLDETEFDEEKKQNAKFQSLLELREFTKKNGKLKIGFVFPMSGIRGTIKDVFDSFGNSLSKNMVLNPNQLRTQEYDILFVDESHRLSKRKNLTNYAIFDKNCEYYKLNKYYANQLDFIMLSAKYKVLFYDEDQSVKSSDVSNLEFKNTLRKYGENINYFNLSTQMRCEGGSDYIDYVKNILNCSVTKIVNVDNYDFKMYDNVADLITDIRKLDQKYGLSKTVAGFSWKWVTKPKKKVPNNLNFYKKLISENKYDIDILGNKYIWNLTTENWISRDDSRYTIGCIHTTQGFDMNYVGVIFGEEIDYNPITNSIEINLKKFMDSKVKDGTDEETVKRYIKNTYTTMMARGIKGCYVYACNKNLRDYLKKFIKVEEKE